MAVPAAPELRDLNVAVVPSLDPAGFFTALHEGLFARQGLHEQSQQLADISRAAIEALPPPLGLAQDIAALISLDSYQVGLVDAVRIQRVADVMRQFLGAPPVQRHVDAIGVSMTVTLWRFLIVLRARALEKGDLMRTTWS